MRNRWGKVGKVAVILLTLLVCVAAVAYSLTDVSAAAAKCQANHDRGKKLGLVFDAADAAKLSQVSSQDNAFPQVMQPLQIFNKLDETSDIKISDQDFLVKWQSHNNDFTGLEGVCEKRRLIFDNKPIQAEGGPTPHFAWMKGVSRVLMRRANLCANRGEIELGHRICRTVARFTVMIDDDPSFMASLVRLAIDSIVTKELKTILAFHGQDPRWQAILQEALTILDKPYDFRNWIKREHWNATHTANVLLGAEQPEDRAYFGLDSGGIPLEFRLLRAVPRMRIATMSRLDEGYSIALEKYPSDLRNLVAVEMALTASSGFFNNDGLSFRLCFFILNHGPAESLIRVTVNRYTAMQGLEILRRHFDPSKGLPLKGRFAVDVDGKPL